jgi:hypothetical protein
LTELVIDGEVSVLTMLVWFGPHVVVTTLLGGSGAGGEPSGGFGATWATASAAVAEGRTPGLTRRLAG